VAPGGEIAVDRQLARGQPALLELSDLGGRERLLREVRQRRAAPHAEPLAQEHRRALRVAVGERPPAAFDQLVEALDVELAGPDPQAVAAGRRLDHRAVAERPAQARDVHLQGLDRSVRRVVAPQRERQPIGAHGLVGVQQQDGQQRARLRAARDRSTVSPGADLERSQDAVTHVAPRC
jgi:hypothetical protein